MIDKDFGRFVPLDLRLKTQSFEFELVENRLRKYYFDNKPVTWNLLNSYLKILGDFNVRFPAYRSTYTMSALASEPIYTYEFGVDGDRRPFDPKLSYDPSYNISGASHFDDVGYLFKSQPVRSIPLIKDSVEWNVVKTMTKFWTNFAKFGNPNGLGQNLWKPHMPDHEFCLMIQEHRLELQHHGCNSKSNWFWRHLYDAFYLLPNWAEMYF